MHETNLNIKFDPELKKQNSSLLFFFLFKLPQRIYLFYTYAPVYSIQTHTDVCSWKDDDRRTGKFSKWKSSKERKDCQIAHSRGVHFIQLDDRALENLSYSYKRYLEFVLM